MTTASFPIAPDSFSQPGRRNPAQITYWIYEFDDTTAIQQQMPILTLPPLSPVLKCPSDDRVSRYQASSSPFEQHSPKTHGLVLRQKPSPRDNTQHRGDRHDDHRPRAHHPSSHTPRSHTNHDAILKNGLDDANDDRHVHQQTRPEDLAGHRGKDDFLVVEQLVAAGPGPHLAHVVFLLVRARTHVYADAEEDEVEADGEEEGDAVGGGECAVRVVCAVVVAFEGAGRGLCWCGRFVGVGAAHAVQLDAGELVAWQRYSSYLG